MVTSKHLLQKFSGIGASTVVDKNFKLTLGVEKSGRAFAKVRVVSMPDNNG